MLIEFRVDVYGVDDRIRKFGPDGFRASGRTDERDDDVALRSPAHAFIDLLRLYHAAAGRDHAVGEDDHRALHAVASFATLDGDTTDMSGIVRRSIHHDAIEALLAIAI